MRRRNGSLPALEWFNGLDEAGKAKVLAAFKILENSLLAHRPAAGRADKVGNASRAGLWELRVTPRGASPPHLRMLYLRKNQVIWAANGFKKEKNQLDRQDIRAGDAIATEWLEGGEE